MAFKKLKFRLKSWRSTIKLPIPYEDISAVKIRYLLYTTAAAGEEDMQLSCREFSSSGYLVNENGSNDEYFCSIPLDLQANVTCLYSNFTEEVDVQFPSVMRSLHQFTIECLINGSPASTQITDSNPVVVEIGFY